MAFRVLGDLLASRRLKADLAVQFPDYTAGTAYEAGDVVADPATGELYRVTAAIASATDLATDAANVSAVDKSSDLADNGDGTYTFTKADGTTQDVDTRASSAPFNGAGSGADDAGVAAATTVEEAIQALDSAINAANDSTGVAVDPTNFDGGNNAVLSGTDGDVQTALDTIDEALRDFAGTDGVTAGAQGLVPAPATGDANKFLASDGTWSSVTATGADAAAADTTNFDGALTAAEDTVQKALDALDDIVTPIADFATKPGVGIVPAKADASDDAKFLRGDGTWQDASVPQFSQETGSGLGDEVAGIVPGPKFEDTGKVLGTAGWQDVPSVTQKVFTFVAADNVTLPGLGPSVIIPQSVHGFDQIVSSWVTDQRDPNYELVSGITAGICRVADQPVAGLAVGDIFANHGESDMEGLVSINGAMDADITAL